MISHPFHIFEPFRRKLDVALFTKADDGIVTDEDAGKAMGSNDVAALHQVHGNHAIVIREGLKRTIQADALATDTPLLTLTIRAADCQPFIIYAPEQHVVALVHAGWKGLLKGILPSTFDLLWEEWNIRPEDVYVGAGPSLCQAHAEFTDPKKELPGVSPAFFDGRNVNLQAIAEDQLWKIGVREERFERHPDCTFCANRTWWTYRGGDREAVQKGATNLLACRLLPFA